MARIWGSTARRIFRTSRPASGRSSTFGPGTWGIPVFDLGFCKIGVYICYDRHFPEGARALGLNGAEIVFNPSATVAGLSEYLWKLEQPAHAVANGYFVGAINRVGTEAPWNIGEFYGQSYFCDPRGQILAEASRDKDEMLTADLDLDKIAEVRRRGSFSAIGGRRCMGTGKAVSGWWMGLGEANECGSEQSSLPEIPRSRRGSRSASGALTRAGSDRGSEPLPELLRRALHERLSDPHRCAAVHQEDRARTMCAARR